ncbi:MAG: metal-sensitive transcriptional regulator [Deinococcales bacterium]
MSRADTVARQTKVLHRLRRLEGQIRGLQKMIEEERECKDILTQLVGARAALNAVGEIILEAYIEDCQSNGNRAENQALQIIEAVRLLRA